MGACIAELLPLAGCCVGIMIIMKILLTSAGLVNRSIIGALADLTERPLGEVILSFIPTAANMEEGDKGWLIEDLEVCRKLFKSVDIVDFPALPKEIWLPRMQRADVLLFGGGHTGYLMKSLILAGLAEELPGLLDERVYVGISAGSMVAGPSLDTRYDATVYLEPPIPDSPVKALGFVPFHIRPHLNSPYFPEIRREKLTSAPSDGETYVLDDQSAVAVKDGKASVVSEGEWFKLSG